MTDFTTFPIPAKKISELTAITALSQNADEVLPLVSGGLTKVITVNNFSKRFKATNTILVKSEADLPAAVGGIIPLDANGQDIIYQLAVPQLILSNRLGSTTVGARIVFESAGNIAVGELVYTGTSTFLNFTNAQTIEFRNISITGATGSATLFNFAGIGKLIRSEIYLRNFTATNFASGGTISNALLLNITYAYFFQCPEIIIDNCFLFTANVVGFQTFAPVGKPFLRFLTNLNQSNISNCAFAPSRGDSAIFIDPAINSNSGISIGPGVPYQGYVTSAITSFSDGGGGTTQVNISAPYVNFNLNNGDTVIFDGSAFYAGAHTVSASSVSSFKINTAFIGNDAVPYSTSYLLLQGVSVNLIPFFTLGVSGSITTYAPNGTGGTRITSNAHGQANNQSLFISGDTSGNYTGGYKIFAVTANTFDIAKPFVANDAVGTWNTGSLTQTNNVVTTNSTGGILPDSQSLIDASNSTLLAFAGTTTFTRVIWTTGWVNNSSERFTIDAAGVVTFRGRRQTKCYVNLEINCAKSGGGTVEVRMNPMYRPFGGSFAEVSRPRALQAGDNTNMQVLRPGIIITLNPGDSIAFGIALDISATLNINSALIQIGIA